jgi:radical SAM protein with 4Fe4S-binding SPASM domain
VTRACPLRCTHCRAEAIRARHPDELDTEEGRDLIDQTAAFGSPPPVLVFSGGDPLQRPDLLELAEYADERGLPTAVIPAPTADVGRETVRALKEAGIRRMALSLDGAGPESHDAFRGEPGSFAAAMEAAEHARAEGLPLQVNTTVTRGTRPELPAIADRVEELGAVTWEVFFLVPLGRGGSLEAPTPEETDEILAWLYRRGREAPFRVMTVEAPMYRRIASQIEVDEGNPSVIAGSTSDGNGFVFVSHTGQVCPSGFLPVSGGDVRDGGLVDIYRNAPLFRAMRDPSRLKGKCGVCEYRKLCGGSRARAWAVTGDPLESDPFCPYVPDVYRERVEAGEAEPVEEYFAARRAGTAPGADGFAEVGSPGT